MNELLRELEEDLKQQRLHDLWKRVGPWLIGTSIAIVLATGAGVAWKAYTTSQNQERAGQLINALAEKEDAKRKTALDAFIKTHPHTPQSAIAQLHSAALAADADKPQDAQALYQQLATDTAAPEAFQKLARVHATQLAAQTKSDVSPAAPGNPAFNAHVKEAEAWKLLAEGKKQDAMYGFHALADDVSAPPSLRARAAEMTAYLTP